MNAQLVPALCLILLSPAAAEDGKSLGRKALETVVSHLRDRDSEVREQAIRVMGETGNKGAAAALRKFLSDPDKHVRIAAAEALWKLGDASGLKTVSAIINDKPAQGPIANSPLVELKMISQNSIRARAVQALASMRGKKAEQALFALRNDNFGKVRDAAALELARLGHGSELEQFIAALSSPDEGIRYEGASALAAICSRNAVQPLRDLLAGETSVRVKMAALEALACSPGKEAALTALLSLASDKNPSVSVRALTALGGIKDSKAFEKLSEVVADSESDLILKLAAAGGLARTGRKPPANLIRRAADSNSAEARREGLELLPHLTDDEASPYLETFLSDADPNIRLEAALQSLNRFSARERKK
ncbi:MAG: HEAT repeat domain-containing protein [Elusimicrobiales bacterium]|nr:HEAT repeat domain-containing protein [Elusimicrobiales bacterium]